MIKKTIYFGSVTLVLAFALIYVLVANAQNVTTNASNAMEMPVQMQIRRQEILLIRLVKRVKELVDF
jgi:hypothetical protein